jgi:hypothetical protein
MQGPNGARSDPLFKGNNSNAHTGSTATSDPPFTTRSFGSTSQPPAAKPKHFHHNHLTLEEIVQEKEILETSIDPLEWKRECERVRDQLMIKLNDKQGGGAQSAFETEAEEINSRRLKMINHIKVVQEFSQSNVPILMDSICSEWQSQLDRIRYQES